MSTRCRIAIKQNDNSFMSIYCHFEGYDYDNGVGPTLRQYFNTKALATHLVQLGNISYLDKNEVCAYHRDRGEKYVNNQPKTSSSESELVSLSNSSGAKYLYIYEDDEWRTHKI